MIRYFTFALAATLFYSIAHAQQGNLPTPVRKLAPYPPIVCVTPNWTPEPCESRQVADEGGRWEWQCGNVNVKVTLSEKKVTLLEKPFNLPASTEYVVTGIEKSNNRFQYVWGKDDLYLNRRLCVLKAKPLPKEDETKPQPPAAELVKCLKPDGTEESCESRHIKPKTVLYDEPGGIFTEHWQRWHTLNLSGHDVEIRGSCVSACTMILAHISKDRLCFGESASLQFHASRRERDSTEPDIPFTRWMLTQYPRDIRNWLSMRGGAEKMTVAELWRLSAEELWAMGYHKCAEPTPIPMTITKITRMPNANQAANLPGTDRTIHEEMERERRKRDEKAAETWRRVNEEKAARGER
jgi:hypothetical protein